MTSARLLSVCFLGRLILSMQEENLNLSFLFGGHLKMNRKGLNKKLYREIKGEGNGNNFSKE
jgi:hypothetical protein